MGAQFFPAPKLSRLNHSRLRKKNALLLVALVPGARAIDSRQDAKTDFELQDGRKIGDGVSDEASSDE